MSKTRWRMPLTIVLLILLGSSLSNQTVSTIKAKQSCLDHYLAGESGTEVNRNVILPIATTGSDADNTYFIECRMPKSAQPHLLVESVVKNGLEQWHGIRSGEKRTIGYQVRDKHLMERLLKDSDTCEQTITVDWNEWIAYEAFKLANQQPFYGTASSETEEPFEDADPPFFQKVNQKHNFNYPNQFKLNLGAKSSDELLFELITYSGQSIAFKRRDSERAPNGVQKINLIGEDSGIVHVISPETSSLPTIPRNGSESFHNSPFVKLSPLICKQTVVARNECIFELNSISDKVTVNLTPLDQTLTVNFRSDVPSSRFLTIHYQNGKILNVDIVDGYLLTVNHLIHSLKFISGGDWHQLSIDLVNQLLYVDSMVTAVSIAPVNKDNHKKMITAIEFNLNGQITNLKLNTENSQLCDGSPRLQIHRTELFLRKICPHYEANYCHCKGPNSVFGTSKNNTPFSCPVEIKTNNAFQLARTQDQLAFFYIPKFDYHSTISVLFKSDSNSGLIFFGTTTSEKSKETSIMQVHFVNENIYAMQCFKTDHHVRRCQACTLKRKNGFAVDNWIRVSMFHYSEYHFLTVDEHICQLVPNSLDAEGALIYKISENVDKALFVGGMMYAKSSSLWKKMNAESINPFIDTTREKPPSLRGCISELYVNGEKQDLSKLFTEQVALFSKDSNNDAFSMIPRCNSCSEESVCHGARCRPATANLDSESICDCASIFSIKKPNSQSCMLPDFVDTNVTLKNEEIVVPNLLLSHDAPVLLENIKFFGNRRALLDKVFILIRFPVTSDNLVTILDFGSIRVLVGNKGTRIVIEIDFAHREEFTINNNDNRLNLLNFERTPTIGTSSESRSIKVQLNDDIRYVPIEEIPLVNGAELTISPIASQTNIQNPGCISSFSVSYEYKEASHKHYIENRVDQKDVLHMIVTELRKQDPLLASKLIQSNPCGIRDSNLWTSPSSSSIGMMAEYTPDPFSQPRLSSINWKHFLSFLVIIMVVVLLCICISLNCILRIRRRGSYKTKNLNDAGTNGYNIIKKPIPKDKYDSHPRKKRSRLANNGEQDYLNYDVTTADSPKTTSTHTPPSPDEWQRQPVRASRTYIERISLPKTQHTSPYDTPLTGKTSRSNKYSYNDDSFLNDSINFGDTPSSYVYKAPIALAEEDFRGVTSKNL